MEIYEPFITVELPYSARYPIVYALEPDGPLNTSDEPVERLLIKQPKNGNWDVVPGSAEVLRSDENNGKSTSGSSCLEDISEADEKIHILAEAWRGLREQCGDTLFFSEPVRSASMVYRGECKLRQHKWVPRYAWMVHFFQAAYASEIPDGLSLVPRRYGGFVFVRPWQVHCAEAKLHHRDLDAPGVALGHRREVNAGICEGYVRPRVSFERSPSFSQVAKNYSEPYDVLPFNSLPFFCPQVGGLCPDSALATALAIVAPQHVFSPYEIAAARTHLDAGPDDLVAIPPMDLNSVEKIMKNLQLEKVVNILTETVSPSGAGLATAFAKGVASYLYQGIPVLCAVDVERLYGRDETGPQHSGPNDEKNHIVLLHSIWRQGGGPGSETFVMSDTRNLERTGNVFQKIAPEDLLACLAGSTNSRRKGHKDSPEENSGFCVCAPEGLSVSHSMLAEDYPMVTAQNVEAHLRDRSQLRGFLIQRVFNSEFKGKTTDPGLNREVRKFREALRGLCLPRYFWIIESVGRRGCKPRSALRSLCALWPAWSTGGGRWPRNIEGVIVRADYRKGIPAEQEKEALCGYYCRKGKEIHVWAPNSEGMTTRIALTLSGEDLLFSRVTVKKPDRVVESATRLMPLVTKKYFGGSIR